MFKKQNIYKIFIIVLTFFTLFSFSVSNATEDVGKALTFDGRTLSIEEILERLENLRTENPFEMTLSGYALSFGDSILEQATFMYKQKVSVDRIVFNDVLSLNANFFELSKGEIETTNATRVICGVINNWYNLFRGLAIIAYMITLIYVGIKIILRYS